MSNVNLYKFPQVSHINRPNAVSISSVVNRTDFNIFKHIDNDVEFVIHDWDNKVVNLTNYVVKIYIVDYEQQVLMPLANNILAPVVATQGHCRLTLHRHDTINWPVGYYSFSITMTDITNKETPVFVDRSRQISGFFEIFEGPLPQPVQPIVIPSDLFTLQSPYMDETVSTWKVAEQFPGSAQTDNRYGNHAIAVYTDNFTGSLRVQASLENNVPNDEAQWFDVTLNNGHVHAHFDFSTGVTGFTFKGNYMWLRFIQYLPTLNEGEITQIILKNQ
jgi:hypothetical protein